MWLRNNQEVSRKLLVSANGNGEGTELRGEEMVNKNNILPGHDSDSHTLTEKPSALRGWERNTQM
jgi:hypothetical protein